MTFALFFLGEYANMILRQRDGRDPVPRRLDVAVPYRAVHLGAGRWSGSRSRSRFLLFVFLWVRATFPRFRYDQLMRLGWKVFLPLSLFWLVLTAGVLPLRRLRPLTGTEARSMVSIEGRSMRSLWRAARAASCSGRAAVGLGADLALHVQAQGDGELSLREGAAQRRASAASTRCAATPTARNAASPASSARRSARRRRSPSRPSRATTAAGARRATTST